MIAKAEVIPDGDEGTFTVVDRMAELVRSRIAHPVVRRAAVDLANKVPPQHLSGQIAAVRKFLERRVPFLSDPSGVELLHDPVLLLEDIRERGTARGDCDDVAVLGAALGGALGLSARFVVVGFRGPNEPFEHVWTELHDGTAWRELDVTRPRTAEAPAPTREYVVDVLTGEVPAMQRYPLARRYPLSSSRRLGFIDPVTITAVTGFITAVSPWLGGSKEPDRIKVTDVAFQRAITGDPVALLFLKQRTGQYGVITMPPPLGEVGGWGSSTARAYALRKYNEALAILGESHAPPPTTPPGPSAPEPTAQAGVGMGTGAQLALLAIGAVVVFSVLKPRRSR